MAQFSYEAYSQQQAEKRAGNPGGQRGSQTHFVNEFLKSDGDSVVVRFPYQSLNDVKFETTHTVAFPGEKYGKRVRCETDDCPLCKQGVKIDTRFFVKAIVYVIDPSNGNVTLVPAIWDRPAAFADIDLKTKMREATEDFGTTLDNLLVRIRRNGTGLDTKYDLSLSLNNNKTVYNPEVYKKDFSGLDAIDPSKILTKSVQQYLEALNPEMKEDSDGAQRNQPAREMFTPQEEQKIEQALNIQTQPQVQQPVATQSTTPIASDRPKRYSF